MTSQEVIVKVIMIATDAMNDDVSRDRVYLENTDDISFLGAVDDDLAKDIFNLGYSAAHKVLAQKLKDEFVKTT